MLYSVYSHCAVLVYRWSLASVCDPESHCMRAYVHCTLYCVKCRELHLSLIAAHDMHIGQSCSLQCHFSIGCLAS